MIKIYCSSPSHKRYENGVYVEESHVQRNIVLDYSLDGRSVEVSIMPTLSPKKAILTRDSGNTLYYKGVDPDYEFELHTNHNNQVDIMRLKRLDKNLMIEYTCLVD